MRAFERVTRVVFSASLVAVAAGSLGACGNLTAGGFGDAKIMITGGDEEPGTAPSTTRYAVMPEGDASGPRQFGEGPSLHEASRQLLPESLTGTLQVRLQVYVLDTSGFWMELTDGERRVTLPLTGGAMEEVISRRIQTGLYPRMRIVFNAVEADVTDGLVIGGVPLVGIVRVQTVPAITVERSLDLVVDDREPKEVVIDLNAGGWLETTNPLEREVAPEEFESRVDVRAGSS